MKRRTIVDFSKFLSEKQRAILDRIHELMEGFYKDNDNWLTYALAGLISELTQQGQVSRKYVKEKISLIFPEE